MRKSDAFGVSVILLLILASPARATLTFVNGSFEDVGSATSSFSINQPTVLPNWTASPSGNKILDCLVFSTDTTNLCGNAFGGGMSFWTNPGASPDGGNFVAIDGDPNFRTPLDQTVTDSRSEMTMSSPFIRRRLNNRASTVRRRSSGR